MSSTALTNLSEAKWNKITALPKAEDIHVFNSFLSINLEKAGNELKKACNLKNWMNLTQLCLTSVIVFNRRRVGEVSKLLLDTYQNTNKETNKDIAGGRKVPLLLTQGW